VHIGQDRADEPDDGGGVGKMPRTRARRLISLLTRSKGLVLQIFGQCGRGNAVNANTSALAASIKVPMFGNRVAS
jgi:hypothetical protein